MRDASICGLGQAAPNPLKLGDEAFPARDICDDRPIKFTLDGDEVEAAPGETIWQVAKRHGIDIPHLCYVDRARLPRRRQLPRLHGRDRGRARAGRLLHPQADGRHEGQDRHRARQESSRKMVFELLVADQPARADLARSRFEILALGRKGRGDRKPLPGRRAPSLRHQPSGHGGQPRRLHPLQPLRARLPRGAGQRRHRHGRARGHHGRSSSTSTTRWATATCVACGECVQACPTGALMPAALLDDNQTRTQWADREVDSLCPYLRRRLPGHLSGQGRQDHLCRGPRRPGQPQPALRQGPLRLRLRPPSRPADRAADPQGRRAQIGRRRGRSRQSLDAFPRGHLGRGAGARRRPA